MALEFFKMTLVGCGCAELVASSGLCSGVGAIHCQSAEGEGDSKHFHHKHNLDGLSSEFLHCEVLRGVRQAWG